jgi:NAD(P)H-flavin reductase/hemoglobin-like flavoprotein
MTPAGTTPTDADETGTDTVDAPVEVHPRVLVRRSFAVVEPRLDEVLRRFYAELFALAPELRTLFPVDMSTQRARLARALRHVINESDEADTQVFLAQLGRDHRKFDIVDEHYDVFGRALLIAIGQTAGTKWTAEVAAAWQQTYDEFADIMRGAARAEKRPATWSAEVTAHRRIGHDLALLRLEPDSLLDIRPGQYMAVEIPQRPRLWCYLSPANLPAADGFIELYVKAVGSTGLSRAIVSSTQEGDRWRLGPPLGRLGGYASAERGLLMVGGGTGIAPIHSIVRHIAVGNRHPNDVSVFYGARTAEELHALSALRSLSYRHDWLNVAAVVEGGARRPDMQLGRLPDIVIRYGAWSDFEVILSGSPGMLRATVNAMLTAGTARERIHFDPFTID